MSSLDQSIAFLRSDAARRMIEADPYWPKWDGPWWQMLLLHERGETALIPNEAVEWMVSAMSRYRLKTFTQPFTLPPGLDPYRDAPCHCALGTMSHLLHSRGVDVEAELPWIRTWLLSAQMKDGGLNCDDEAYSSNEPNASSMVATVAALEGMMAIAPHETQFIDRAAECLLHRELRLGSRSKHNEGEQEDEADWLLPCFPRFYFYDVLRGLEALVRWSELREKSLPATAVMTVVEHLRARFPDGQIRVGRQAYAGARTIAQNSHGQWERNPNAASFPLLVDSSRPGDVSPALTERWARTQRKLSEFTRT